MEGRQRLLARSLARVTLGDSPATGRDFPRPVLGQEGGSPLPHERAARRCDPVGADPLLSVSFVCSSSGRRSDVAFTLGAVLWERAGCGLRGAPW